MGANSVKKYLCVIVLRIDGSTMDHYINDLNDEDEHREDMDYTCDGVCPT